MADSSRQKEIREVRKTYSWFYPLILGVVLLGVGVWIGASLFRDKDSYGMNLFTEFVGIGGTVFIINQIYERRDRERYTAQLKRDLIRKARSQVNETAVHALEQLDDHSWLKGENGVLAGADLTGANLSKAPLSAANLQKSVLILADMQEAILIEAELQGAKIEWADLSEARLFDADLCGASLHEANLEGAYLNGANLLGADLVRAKIDGVELYRATLPDGTKYNYNVDVHKFTDMNHSDFSEALESVNRVRHDLGLDWLGYYG